jgi:hypothetical protein
MSTIKISELGNLTAVLGNTIVPVVSNVAGTLTTVKSNVTQLAQYVTSGAVTYGNIIPSANVTYSLGNVTHKWKDLYLSGSTLYLGNSTISSTGGGIVVASAPSVLFNSVVTTNNVVPANIRVTGGYANGSGNLSATLTYLDGTAALNTLALTYGTDYVIWPEGGGAANLQILLTSTYLYSTLGWIGFANVYITETSTSSTTITNVGITTDSILTPSGDLSIAANLSITDGYLSVNSAVITSDGVGLTTPALTVLGGITTTSFTELTGDLLLRETGYDGANAAGTVALYVSSDGGAWGKEGALIVEPNNADGNGIVPSNPSQYTLGTVDFPWLNVYTDELTSPTIDDITANLSVVSGSLATLTANAGAQAGSIATITSSLATLTANAGAQAGSIATITSNLGAVSGTLTTLTANAGAQAGSIATNSDAIDSINSTLANAVSYNATFNNVTIASPTSIGTQGNIVFDINYVYICVASNAWIRTARVSW